MLFVCNELAFASTSTLVAYVRFHVTCYLYFTSETNVRSIWAWSRYHVGTSLFL